MQARCCLTTAVSSVALKRLYAIASTRDWHPSAGNDPARPPAARRQAAIVRSGLPREFDKDQVAAAGWT